MGPTATEEACRSLVAGEFYLHRRRNCRPDLAALRRAGVLSPHPSPQRGYPHIRVHPLFTEGSLVIGRLATPPTSVGFAAHAAGRLRAGYRPCSPKTPLIVNGFRPAHAGAPKTCELSSLSWASHLIPRPFRREPWKLETSQDFGLRVSRQANVPFVSALLRGMPHSLEKIRSYGFDG